MSQPIADDRGTPPGEGVAAQLSPLRAVLRSLGAPETAASILKLPSTGDELFGFRLRYELGRGAFARVFLAEQADLAGRPVVLKISAIKGNEPHTLAQLQHTHIVPIYSVHEDAGSGLRVICMPSFGGASLSRVLQFLWAETKRPMKGKQLVQALEAVWQPVMHSLPSRLSAQGAEHQPQGGESTPTPPEVPQASGQPPTALLSSLPYIRAVAWLVARLAEALQHAHQRGVLHRDIKPSNILLGADGQPMLLDFNLSQNLQDGQARAAATLGGTVAYMAPEHLRALATRESALARRVDQRADIYSLGMVLYEMLAGCSPFDQSASYSVLPVLIQAMAVERSCTWPSLREHRPDVPWSLESIGRKCLAPDPADRYQHAEQLAEDLRCFLEDRPLKHAAELSRVERVQKWMRRHPRLTSSGPVATAAALLLVTLGFALFGIRGHLADTRERLLSAQAQERKRAYENGTLRALCLVNTTTDLHDHLRQGQAVCEETLALYGALDRDDWQEDSDWQRLTAGERRRLAEDTRELLILLAWARVRSAGSDRNQAVQRTDAHESAHYQQALRGALALLDRAQAIGDLSPSRALWEDRALYLEQLHDMAGAKAARERARQLRPVSARDHYLLALVYTRNLRYAEAVEELDQALRLNPRHYWSSFQRGICHLELGKFALATGDFGTCIGLWPEFAWGYFNRGAALYKTGAKGEAIRDYSAALERDPNFLLAYLNRGMARLELEQYPEALVDFQQAANLGGDDPSLHAGRAVALERLGRPQEADAAFRLAFDRAATAAPEVRSRIGCAYGFAVSARLPDNARQAFDDILRHHPNHAQALYGRAMLLSDKGKQHEALTCFDRAIDANPSFVEARRFRAVLLARCGNLEAASQDMNWCLAKEPDAGVTLYAAACVAARAAEKAVDPAAAKLAADQAIAFLQKAFARGYGPDKAAKDPDLKGICNHPEFQLLLARQ